ncbi:hypothetical protein HDU76_002951 [Blyttiomyces sp. JEL0837]|nr:hypothetical protein HDU76_002951 [Blyttiomyces sp. JEL0837]
MATGYNTGMPFCISLHIIVNVVAYGNDKLDNHPKYNSNRAHVTIRDVCTNEIFKIDFGAMTPLEILQYKEMRQNKINIGKANSELSSNWCSDAVSVPEYPSVKSGIISVKYQSSRDSTFASEGGKNSFASVLGYRSSVMRSQTIKSIASSITTIREKVDPLEFSPNSLELKYLNWQHKSFMVKYNLCILIFFFYGIMHTFLDIQT